MKFWELMRFMIKKYIKKIRSFKLISYLYYHIYLEGIFLLEELIYKKQKNNTNKIVVDNFAGKGFGDNPKYIVEALLKKKPNLDIVWEVSDMALPMPHGVRKVKYRSFKAYKELLTAKVWIDNIKTSSKPQKKENQFYLQTWHAGLGLKASEQQIEDDLSKQYVKMARRDASMTNLMLSDSEWTTDIYKNYFWYNGPIAKTGFPRNDLLVNQQKNIKEKVYSFFKINKTNRIVMYAPTFRDNSSNFDIYKFDFLRILNILKEKFNSDYVLLIRLHPNISNNTDIYKFNSRFVNAGQYPDMQELILASDILITDYSSCMFDAMIAKKKVFLLAKDLTCFEKKDRKLLFNIKSDVPFTFSNNEDELITNIRKYNEVKYNKQIAFFESKVNLFEDGHAAERVADIILDKL